MFTNNTLQAVTPVSKADSSWFLYKAIIEFAHDHPFSEFQVGVLGRHSILSLMDLADNDPLGVDYVDAEVDETISGDACFQQFANTSLESRVSRFSRKDAFYEAAGYGCVGTFRCLFDPDTEESLQSILDTRTGRPKPCSKAA